MTAAENICPVCKTNNTPDATLCVHCGATLDAAFVESGPRTKTTDMQALTPDMIREWSSKEAKQAAVPEQGIAFYVDGHANPAYSDSKGEIILGRKAETTSERLLDLAPFGGYSMGLSRRHAVIRQVGDGYELMDLGSVNGTFLNEERLVPQKTYPLPSGSHLRLGRLRMLVLYRSAVEST